MKEVVNIQKIIYSLIIALVISVGAVILNKNTTQNFEKGIVRLHIVANSNSEKDQKIKLKVRDEIIKNADMNNDNFLKDAQNTAQNVLNENNVQYTAAAEYGKFYFPKKAYKNVTLPKGQYYGVRITLGEAKGENWWCIMYPPLCPVNDTEMVLDKKSEKELKKRIDDSSFELITSSDDKITVRFKALEIIEGIKNMVKNRGV